MSDRPVFPGPCQSEQRVDIHEGITLREMFAAVALHGILTRTDPLEGAEFEPLRGSNPQHIAGTVRTAVIWADAMLAELEARQ